MSATREHGRGPIGAPLFGTTRQTLELVGYFYGLGAAIVALAAFSIGRFASRPRVAEQAAIARAARSVPPKAPLTLGGGANARHSPLRPAHHHVRRR